MKETLEKIVNSVKEVGRTIKKHGFKIATAIALPFIFSHNADSAEIQIANCTTQPTNPKVNNMIGYFRTFSDANEGADYHDGSFLPSQEVYALEVSSMEPGFKAKINAKPFNTPYGKFSLGFYSENGSDYPKTIDNILRLRVSNTDGLEHRHVIACDSNDPSNSHNIPKDGSIYEINLPRLVKPSPGKYFWLDIATPPIVPGDCGSAAGPGILDGVKNIYDVATVCSGWLQETFEGENYLDGDLNYDGLNDFIDYSIVTNNDY